MSLLRGGGGGGRGGLMREIKIPQYEFVLKMQGGGGAYARGGRICGTLWYMVNFIDYIQPNVNLNCSP